MEDSYEEPDRRVSENEDLDERTQIRKELADMSFEDIQKLKDDLGAKVFNEAYHGKPLRKHPQSRVHFSVKSRRSQAYSKQSKHAPREESSKMRVPSVRDVVLVPKVIRRDPRFDGVSGSFDEKAWQKNYKFVDELKSSEKDRLKEQYHQESDPSEKKKLKLLLQRIQNKEKARKVKEEKEAQEHAEREENISRLKAGKKPVYKSKGFKKKEALAEKFLALKESGRLDKYMQKKRKKDAGKSKKQLLT
ncbi:ribosomal RNA processing protein 36 homolog [Pollicipes pollicipes]|uniref:ribosomal RNA processing protein 36 homolog n=1 Tax=Pollicipes pollicipes TaxID=41117 RepID=UPI001884AFB2|nr:ribosomal RNA processing protein 36 homolog [Pollicipes pollicipes]XP_037082917.1 ribosomal RNA processing protein 36 homolog [Pollicipes pollicipes]XP_037082918.1 ribosomal RNA processing protein 36 homolog [Pollicipes pollicipes]XP_037082919.1 ribosomal RNA processing protein 36 homolog [Pollicipes pollicipes]